MLSMFNGEAFVCLVLSRLSPSVPFLGINSRTQSLSMQSVFVSAINPIHIIRLLYGSLSNRYKTNRESISLFIGSNLDRTLNWDTIHQHQLQRKLVPFLLSVHHMSGIEVMHHMIEQNK